MEPLAAEHRDIPLEILDEVVEAPLFLLFQEGFLGCSQVPAPSHMVHMNPQMLFHLAQAGLHDSQLLLQHPLPAFGPIMLPPPLLLFLQPPLFICQNLSPSPALLHLRLKFRQHHLYGPHPQTEVIPLAFLPLLLPLEPLQALPQFPVPGLLPPLLHLQVPEPPTGPPEEPSQIPNLAPQVPESSLEGARKEKN